MIYLSELPAFGSVTECPKCGGSQFKVRYTEVRSEPRHIYDNGQVIGSCMMRSCECGYEWPEKAKDGTT